jgi:hypothetical protein
MESITVYTGKHAAIFGRLRFATLMACIALPPTTFIYSRHRYFEDYRRQRGHYPYQEPDFAELGWQRFTALVERIQDWVGLAKLSDLQSLGSSSSSADQADYAFNANQWTMQTAYQRSLLGMLYIYTYIVTKLHHIKHSPQVDYSIWLVLLFLVHTFVGLK